MLKCLCIVKLKDENKPRKYNLEAETVFGVEIKMCSVTAKNSTEIEAWEVLQILDSNEYVLLSRKENDRIHRGPNLRTNPVEIVVEEPKTIYTEEVYPDYKPMVA